MMDTYELHPIGEIRNGAEGAWLQIDHAYRPALRALEGFSHLQVIWWCHECDDVALRAILECEQPYQLAPDVMGIFATRSPVRPNPIALSVVEVLAIDHAEGRLLIPYIDANDHTPLLDIKPYTPSMDRIDHPTVPDWCSNWPMSYEESGAFNWEDVFLF